MWLSKFRLFERFCFVVAIFIISSFVWHVSAIRTSAAAPAEAHDIVRKDPPFFRLLTHAGREIYILGSPHFVPLRILFDQRVIEEIDKIREQGAILYTEHEINNREGLGFLAGGGEEVRLSGRFTLFDFCEDLRRRKEEVERRLTGINTFLSWDGRVDPVLSATPLTDVFNAQIWLAALIAGTHANILSYTTYGGTEVDLLRQAGWSAQRHLETPEEAFARLRGRATASSERQHNIDWVERSINKILRIQGRDNLEPEMREAARKFSWVVIRVSASPPPSAFERNKLWVEVIARVLAEEDLVEDEEDYDRGARETAAGTATTSLASAPPMSAVAASVDKTTLPVAADGEPLPLTGGAPPTLAAVAPDVSERAPPPAFLPPLFIVVGSGHLIGRDQSFIGLLLEHALIDQTRGIERFETSTHRWIDAEY